MRDASVCYLCKEPPGDSQELVNVKRSQLDKLVINVMQLIHLEPDETIVICQQCHEEVEMIRVVLGRWEQAAEKSSSKASKRVSRKPKRYEVEVIDVPAKRLKKEKLDTSITEISTIELDDSNNNLEESAESPQKSEFETTNTQGNSTSTGIKPTGVDRTKPIGGIQCNDGTKIANIFESNPTNSLDAEDGNDYAYYAKITMVCTYCYEPYAQLRPLCKHIKTRHRKPFYSCNSCLVAYKSEQELKNHHEEENHEGTQILDVEDIQQLRYTCTHCNKDFGNLHGIWRHYRDVHQANRQRFKCSDCGATFKFKVSLQHHLAKHLGIRVHSYQCEHCDKSFLRQFELKSHLRIHTGEQPYSCEHCGKRFAHRCNYLVHQRIHSNVMPFQCETCGVPFRTSSQLKRHNKLHSDDRPHKKLGRRKMLPQTKDEESCESKEASNEDETTEKSIENLFNSITNDSLLKSNQNASKSKVLHVEIISDGEIMPKSEYRHNCEYCGKGYMQRGPYTKHLRTHTGEHPYKCQQCDKSFSDPSNFKKHKLRVHAGKYIERMDSESSMSSGCDSDPDYVFSNS